MPAAGKRPGEGSVRISGGIARGIELAVPRGDAVRPATDGMRQAVFSSLGPRTEGARFVDLFAGSGAYGLEAFSRGAAGGTFVERSSRASACLRKNIAAVCRSVGKAGGELVAVEADALSLPTGIGDPPDLIFVDPPYEMIGEVAPALFGKLAAALAPGWGGLVVFETPGEVTLEPGGWSCVKRLGRGARQPSVGFYARSA
jgi:16S rRNA (guanine966-N2)-methyltransferase